ncbi:SseB family protein [Geomonas sp. RF6]|uniref:SseB family protein n=1 Tax=Geomonas sp. RF6 TaxID=2897342 RepID=UPI001E52FD57|nr:SseB family protein [Geomonas sp. RF6]UFS70146.1 SseB family protein [Geomonas sp. RF6]
MTELDNALVSLREDMNDAERQSQYYDLFLNATFFVPTMEDDSADADPSAACPLVIEAGGSEYLMLFDSADRLYGWAGSKVPHVEVPGYLLASSTMDQLHWALNVGTDFSKSFLPAEIAWLKEVVEKCEAEAAE